MMPVEIHTQEGLVELEFLPDCVMSAPSIGDTLAKVNRYTGRTPEPWSVAAHSVLVSRLCYGPDEQAWGLLHDAHEAFIGDIISPAVTFIANRSRPVAGAAVESCVREAKIALDSQIIRAWCIDQLAVQFSEIAYFDQVALEAEMFVFFGAPPEVSASDDIDRAVGIIRELPNSSDWRAARALWMSDAERLARLGACCLPRPLTERAA